MSFYLDTSALVSALTPEAETARVQGWLREHERDGLFISAWVTTEFVSALSVKLRRHTLRDFDRNIARAAFDRLRRKGLQTLPVRQSDFQAAARFADQAAVAVRAGDALHLAVAAEHALVLCTLDRQQAEAGPSLGVVTRLL